MKFDHNPKWRYIRVIGEGRLGRQDVKQVLVLALVAILFVCISKCSIGMEAVGRSSIISLRLLIVYW